MPGSTKIIPLGGLGEVGKSMPVMEADGEAVVIDAGLAFPRDEHLGVDLILPDLSYLMDRDRPARAGPPRHGPAGPAGARAPRPRGPRRRASVPPARDARAGGVGDAADPRPREVEAGRARP